MKVNTPKIEKGVPLPSRGGGMGWGWLTPLLTSMKPGDSFIYPGKSISNVYLYARTLKIQVTTHREKDGSVRVWRVS